MIDNFSIIERDVLNFSDEGTFYMILILKRRKDTKGRMAEGVNEDNRLIKHFFVYDREYFNKKRQAIVNLCEQNDARAYILPQRRSCRLVLWNLHDKISDTLKRGSMNTHFDHLIRSCVAGCHDVADKSHKRWVIDIDADEKDTLEVLKALWRFSNPDSPTAPVMFDMKPLAEYLASKIRRALVLNYGNRAPDVQEFMPNTNAAYRDSDICVLETPHGFHIVTPPFNREQKALRKYLGGDFLKQDMIKPDAMALLYAPDSIAKSNPLD